MSPRAKATVIFSVAMLGALLFSIFCEPDFWVRAFGPTLWGLPMPAVVGCVVAGLFLPVPWFGWHAMEIVLHARELGMPLGKLGIFYTLLTIGRWVPTLRRSQLVIAAGLVYFVAVVAVWIWYATVRGL